MIYKKKKAKGTLPIGASELEALERATVKQQIVNMLPKDDDKKSIAIRRKTLSEIEKRDWKFQQHLLQKKQDQRFDVIMNKVRKRDEQMERETQQRLDKLRYNIYERQTHFKDKIHRKRVQCSRKIGQSYAKFQSLLDASKCGVRYNFATIDDYHSFDSKIYLESKALGHIPQHSNDHLIHSILQSEEMQTHVRENMIHLHNQSTSQISGSQNVALKKNGLYSCPNKQNSQNETNNKNRSILKDLNTMEKLLHKTNSMFSSLHDTQAARTTSTEHHSFFDFMIRPPTPKFNHTLPSDLEVGVTLVQSLIRGRAVQNEMCQGKNETLELIEKLKNKDKENQKQ
ncbi:hypothetical protein RFI_06652 [Reticulomyxa filosa]|uniref:Cilia- and flagella-associated protein 91 n=1 Tax=Reticulomyxa filosa TaxID=46433 RepID=X6NYW9_RETFI|nr:hypothetical protein RFI_06652 [Reticulomyxa filosa]|eukprot:ETO30467.1 hypothetical protein RFI_06652 [Reticulomyxa filosa]